MQPKNNLVSDGATKVRKEYETKKKDFEINYFIPGIKPGVLKV